MIDTTPRRRRKRRSYEGPPRVIGYTRVSTTDQSDNGYGLDAQRHAIEQEAGRRGWQTVHWIEDPGFSGKSMRRPGIREALRMLDEGEADLLVVSRLDRLTRKVADFSAIVDRALREGWGLRILDLDLDMTTPQGEMMAYVLASFAQFQRRIIGEQTRNGLERARAKAEAEGKPFRIGRPRMIPEDVRQRILDLRDAGYSFPAIAATLNQASVPTATPGARWHASTIRAVVTAADK